MSEIYIVVGLRGDEVEMCEAFFAQTVALGRAFQVATNLAQYAVNTIPREETLADGAACFTFLSNGKATVKVVRREVGDSLPSQRDPMSFLGGLNNDGDVPKDVAPSGGSTGQAGSYSSAWVASHSQPPALPKYDFLDPTLPVGWFHNGKPALMSDLLANPFDVKDPLWDLTDAQKWALIEVRVGRSPGFRSPIGTADQADAISWLQTKTSQGLMLRDEEIEALHGLREDLMAGAKTVPAP
jgi:hypothetical protein